jgi:hypothetical protein
MSDLQLEHSNSAEKRTDLVGTAHNLGTDHLADFSGDFILEVVPDPRLIASAGRPGANQFGAIRGLGRGSGIGVQGSSAVGIGVFGESSGENFAAVGGQHHADGYGVVGDSTGRAKAGVLGRNPHGDGVRGEGNFGVTGVGKLAGVAGEANGQRAAGVTGSNPGGTGVEGVSNLSGFGGVAGRNVGTNGYGVIGDSNGPNSSGVLGRNPTGAGVRGEGEIGGRFAGTGAQLYLVPGTTAGHPTQGHHEKGEIYLDVGAALFVCFATGEPGLWLKIQTG